VLASPPVTTTWVAFTADTVSVADPPEEIEVGLAVMLIVGGGLEVTVTVAIAETLPPVPVAVAV
jgi:hypothetical protein